MRWNRTCLLDPAMSPTQLVLRDKLHAAERTTRQLADASYAAWGSIDQAARSGSRAANLIMDCSYVASATARLLGHADEYSLQTLAMNLGLCLRVARRCARVCEEQDTPSLRACARAARAAMTSFRCILDELAAGGMPQAAPEDDDAVDVVDIQLGNDTRELDHEIDSDESVA